MIIRTAFLFTLFCSFLLNAQAQRPANEDVTKPVKTIVQSIRFSKDEMALKYFDGEAQGRILLGDDWSKGTTAQQKEFIQLFHSLLQKIMFPKVRDNFKNLVSITYDNPVISNNAASVSSTIIIEHPMKKQEMKCIYTLVKQREWKVVDVTVIGDSMLADIRDEQVKALMKEGGWNHLLSLMRKKNAELSKNR